jgi:hypothetical protein
MELTNEQEKELQKKLKNLTDGQFEQVVFDLNIDGSIIPDNLSRTQKAIEVITVVKQQPNGLQQLEEVLNKNLYQGSKVPLPPPPINRNLLLGVALLIIFGAFGAIMFSQGPSTTPTTPPPTRAPNPTTPPLTPSSSPCSEGYTFEGSGPAPSGVYSGWCNSTSSPGKRYECVGIPGTQKCRKPES